MLPSWRSSASSRSAAEQLPSPTRAPEFLQQLASPPQRMRQTRRWPVKKRMSSRSNSSPPISSTMLRRAVASTNPVFDRAPTLPQSAPTHHATPPQDPPRCASATCALQSVTPPEARPPAPWAGACGVAAIRSPRRTTGSLAGTSTSGRTVAPPISVRPASPPGSSGSTSAWRAASSMPAAVRWRSGTFGSGIARHRSRLRRIPRDGARRRLSGLPERPGRGLRVLGLRRLACEEPEHEAADGEHREPGEKAHDPRRAVDRDGDPVRSGLRAHRASPPSTARNRSATARPGPPSAATV